MARPLNMDTLQQNFWKEEYLKEIILRFGWHQKYGALVKAKQEQHRERRKAAMETTLTLPSLQIQRNVKPMTPPKSLAAAALTKTPKEREPSGLDPLVLEAEMRPVPREVHNLLYQGISHEDEGRYRYLKTRMLLAPEDKYTFPLTSNFNYGWQMGK